MIITGDLVTGRLVLGENAVLWVAGDCTVSADVHSADYDYSMLAVGGWLRARKVRTAGEIIVCRGIEVGTLHGVYNDHSTYAPTLTCETYRTSDRFDVIPQQNVRSRIDDD